MALTGYTRTPATEEETATNTSIKALTSEALQVRRRLAAMDETYHTDDDITKNDTLENTEL